MIIYGFLYCDCIHESAYGTVSLHKTKEGAEAAMNKHKEEKRLEFEEYKKRRDADTEEYCIKENLDEEAKKSLMEWGGKFGDHEDWQVDEFEVLD